MKGVHVFTEGELLYYSSPGNIIFVFQLDSPRANKRGSGHRFAAVPGSCIKIYKSAASRVCYELCDDQLIPGKREFDVELSIPYDSIELAKIVGSWFQHTVNTFELAIKINEQIESMEVV